MISKELADTLFKRIAELEGEVDALLDIKEELEAKCKRYEDALKEIAKMHMAVEMWELAQEALEQSE